MQSLADWDFQKNKDYYPPDAQDNDSCMYNSLTGNTKEQAEQVIKMCPLCRSKRLLTRFYSNIETKIVK